MFLPLCARHARHLWGTFCGRNRSALKLETWPDNRTSRGRNERGSQGFVAAKLAGLKWQDIDFENLQIDVQRSVVDQVVGLCKTEASRVKSSQFGHLRSTADAGKMSRATEGRCDGE